MLHQRIHSPAAGATLLRHFGLGHWPYQAGTARGFADWLFVKNVRVDPLHFQRVIDLYLREVEETADDDLDKFLREEARSFDKPVSSVNVFRERLGKHVSALKADAKGRAVWDAVVLLATEPLRANVLAPLDLKCLKGVLRTLECLRTLAEPVSWHSSYPFESGRCVYTDSFVRIELARLDELLAAAQPWDGNDFEEGVGVAGVLLHLAKDDRLKGLVKGAIQARIAAASAN